MDESSYSVSGLGVDVGRLCRVGGRVPLHGCRWQNGLSGLYLAVVVDLFSRQVVGWSMGSRIDTSLVLDALLMALWRRRPKEPVTVHSDQGSQFTSHDWQDFLRDHNLVSSMSRRGNCHDNAVAESFFQLLKRERVRRQIYPSRDDAKADVFNYIEMFYNPKRKHTNNGMLSPVDFETKQQKLNEAGV